jgi:Ca2+-binding EF-hand superfamily protein
MATMILDIDREANGYITMTELDDILKILYPKQLGDKRLKPILRPFCSSANRVLIDYKKFKKFIENNLETTKELLDQNLQDLRKYS